jgi:hypothetical protein
MAECRYTFVVATSEKVQRKMRDGPISFRSDLKRERDVIAVRVAFC